MKQMSCLSAESVCSHRDDMSANILVPIALHSRWKLLRSLCVSVEPECGMRHEGKQAGDESFKYFVSISTYYIMQVI